MSPLVLDGPMGTELIRRGIELAGPDWSAHAIDAAPETIASIHRDYSRAGAQMHTANTFRTQRRRVGARWEELARRAVAIARASVGSGERVAGSIAPLEDCYRPDLSPGVAAAADHAELARALSSAGVDVLLCETFPNSTEAAVAVEQAARTGVPTWVALTAGPHGDLMTPAAMRAAARTCVGAGARVVLVNCTPARLTLEFVCALADAGLPTGAYANAGDEADGLGWNADADAAANAYAAWAAQWVTAGASVIGSCCGTGPAHIARLGRLNRVESAVD